MERRMGKRGFRGLVDSMGSYQKAFQTVGGNLLMVCVLAKRGLGWSGF